MLTIIPFNFLAILALLIFFWAVFGVGGVVIFAVVMALLGLSSIR